jgi:hypothetical protein
MQSLDSLPKRIVMRGLDPRIGFRGWLIAGSSPAMTVTVGMI